MNKSHIVTLLKFILVILSMPVWGALIAATMVVSLFLEIGIIARDWRLIRNDARDELPLVFQRTFYPIEEAEEK